MGSLNVTQVQLKGVEEIFEKHKDDESKGIKVHFKMDDSGVVELDKIDISFEKEAKEEESTFASIFYYFNFKNIYKNSILTSNFFKLELGNKISSFFGGGADEATTEEKVAKFYLSV